MIGGPDYLVVRALGSGRVHVALVDHLDTIVASLYGAAPARFVQQDTVVTACGAGLRRARGPVVVMENARVDCRACRTASGVDRVAEGVPA